MASQHAVKTAPAGSHEQLAERSENPSPLRFPQPASRAEKPTLRVKLLRAKLKPQINTVIG